MNRINIKKNIAEKVFENENLLSSAGFSSFLSWKSFDPDRLIAAGYNRSED